MPAETDILIISDTHLGAAASSSKDVLEVLDSIKYKKLLILGDLFDHRYIKKLKKDDWDFLSFLEKRAAAGEEIIWLKGNHDRKFPHNLTHLAKIPIMEEYEWEENGKKYIAIHGDQFDEYIKRGAYISKVGDAVNLFITTFNLKRKVLMKMLGKFYQSITKLSDVVAKGALEYADSKNADYIICGHTHLAVIKTKQTKAGKEIFYYNSGSWTQKECSYITIDNTGPKIHMFPIQDWKKIELPKLSQ